MIIGISGKKQHGKDTVANLIIELTTPKPYRHEEDEFGNPARDVKGEYILKPEYSKWQKKQFAYKLKKIVCELIGCTMEQLENNNFKERKLGEEWRVWYFVAIVVRNGVTTEVKTSILYNSEEEAWHNDNNHAKFKGAESIYPLRSEILTPRKLLQLMGTECGRNIIHPNIWVNATMAEYKPVWRDPNPIEGNDYTISKIIRNEYEDTSLIYYNNGLSEAEVFNHEIVSPNWLITDVRFPNEVEAIKKRGGIVLRVNRPSVMKCHCGVSYKDHHIFNAEGIPTSSTYRHPYVATGDAHESETALDKYTEWDGIILNEDMKSLTGQVINYLTYYKII